MTISASLSYLAFPQTTRTCNLCTLQNLRCRCFVARLPSFPSVPACANLWLLPIISLSSEVPMFFSTAPLRVGGWLVAEDDQCGKCTVLQRGTLQAGLVCSVDSPAVHTAAAAAAATCCHAASGLLHWTCSCSSASTAPGDRRLEINSSQLGSRKLNPATAQESVVYLVTD